MSHQLIGIARCTQVVKAMVVADAAAALMFDRALHQRDQNPPTTTNMLCRWHVDIVYSAHWQLEGKAKICFRFKDREGKVDRVIFPLKLFQSTALMRLIGHQERYPDSQLVQLWDMDRWKNEYEATYPVSDLTGDYNPQIYQAAGAKSFPYTWREILVQVRDDHMCRLSAEAQLGIIQALSNVSLSVG